MPETAEERNPGHSDRVMSTRFLPLSAVLGDMPMMH